LAARAGIALDLALVALTWDWGHWQAYKVKVSVLVAAVLTATQHLRQVEVGLLSLRHFEYGS
jgi:hypothetical protein